MMGETNSKFKKVVEFPLIIQCVLNINFLQVLIIFNN